MTKINQIMKENQQRNYFKRKNVKIKMKVKHKEKIKRFKQNLFYKCEDFKSFKERVIIA